jgi:hypothetical protein
MGRTKVHEGTTIQLNARIGETLYNEFAFVAGDMGENVTSRITKLMKKDVATWKKDNNVDEITLPKKKGVKKIKDAVQKRERASAR